MILYTYIFVDCIDLLMVVVVTKNTTSNVDTIGIVISCIIMIQETTNIQLVSDSYIHTI